MKKNYRKTLLACYLGFITQAIAANFAPLLFLKFHTDYGIPLGKIALIPTAFFFTQLLIDLFCAKFVDRIGYRTSVVLSEITSALGLAGLAVLPDAFADPFFGVMVCVVIYAIGSGLIEVVGSPIVEACPFENKDTVMSTLHSFYCWGSVGVILLSTLFFSVFGIAHWKWLACLWALVPLYNIYNFATCPIERLTEEGKGMTVGQLFQTPIFWIAIVLMVCAGASELSMAQWASAYTEAALGFSKTVGDLAGPCLFAVTMGISRTIYGKYGTKMNLSRFMVFSGALCLCCYLLASLSAQPMVGLIGCIFCGFSVGIMWPGTISIISPRLPRGGTALFAMLAMAGDLGGAFGPSLVGAVTQQAGDNLQAGMLVGSIFPFILIVAVILLEKKRNRPVSQ
ncbi:MAG: MFS transporter [Clostridia bacterium]|nr:MFS transporter [Clostridia bacterium]MBR0408199.1 MFS transporter [Clostridia bacterium]